MLIGARTAAWVGGGESAYEVEWIQKPNGRTGYLDSGVYGNKDCVLKCKIRRIDPTNINGGFFGSTDAWNNNLTNYVSYSIGNENRCYISVGTKTWKDLVVGVEYEYVINPSVSILVKVDGTSWPLGPASDNGFETRWPIGFFSMSYGTKNNYANNVYGNARFIGHIVIDRPDGTHVKEFVPMVKNGVPCYFDSVNSEWYDLHNPENFEYGPPVA